MKMFRQIKRSGLLFSIDGMVLTMICGLASAIRMTASYGGISRNLMAMFSIFIFRRIRPILTKISLKYIFARPVLIRRCIPKTEISGGVSGFM